MTKQYWNDWKEQVYQTSRIHLSDNGRKYSAEKYGLYEILPGYYPETPDRILDATFVGDKVLLTIVRFTKKIGKMHKEIMHEILLERTHIKSVEIRK